MVEPDSAHLARSKRTKVDELIKLHEALTTFAPELYRARDWADWECIVLDGMPQGVDQTLIENTIQPGLRRELEVLDEFSTMLGVSGGISLAPIHSGVVSTSGSAGTALYGQVFQLIRSDDPQTVDFAHQNIIRYDELQEKHEARARLCELLEKVNPDRRAEFERVCDTVVLAEKGNRSHNDAGTAMRNFVQHLKGDLWKAIRGPKEQKCSWKRIVTRLSLQGTPPSILNDSLEIAGHLEGSGDIWDDLSRLLKDEHSPDADHIRVLFEQLLSYLLTLLGRLDLVSSVSEMNVGPWSS